LTLLAAGLRFWRLASVPLGLHGDEAWTGLDARRAVVDGWIGPYLLSALGQPIGPVYWTGLLFAFLPDTTWVLRGSMAFFGVLTIPLSYATFRVMFGRGVAGLAALLLCVMMWHLHLSRTAFMVQTWPFVEMAVLLALFAAIERRSLPLFAVAGVFAGFGVYTYNSYLVFLPVPLVAIVIAALPSLRDANRLGVWIIGLALFVASAVLAAAPMIEFAHDEHEIWTYHQDVVLVTEQEDWKSASWLERGETILERAWEWKRGLTWGDREDLGDGLAAPGHPPVGIAVSVLAGLGLLSAIWRWRRPEYATLIAAYVCLPWGALLTVEDGLFRRTLGLAPFVAVLAAIPLAWAWQRYVADGSRRRAVRVLVAAAVIGLPLYTALKTTYDYFGPVQDTHAVRFTFPYQLDAASRHMATLPDGTIVYLYSDRWSFAYETRLFLAPRALGLDRSFEFRGGDPQAELDFSADRTKDSVFMLLGGYVTVADLVEEEHPGGVLTEQVRDGEVLFRAYAVPAE